MERKKLIWSIVLAAASTGYIVASLCQGLQSFLFGVTLAALVGRELILSLRHRNRTPARTARSASRI